MADVNDDPQVRLALEHSRLERSRLSRGAVGQKCCQCKGNGTCTICQCKIAGRRCTSCLPQSRNRTNASAVASNIPVATVDPVDSAVYVDTTVPVDSAVHVATTVPTSTEIDPSAASQACDIDRELETVYGDQLENGPGIECSDMWYGYWEKVVRLPPRRYDLPGGSDGRRFVDILAREVTCVARQNEKWRFFTAKKSEEPWSLILK